MAEVMVTMYESELYAMVKEFELAKKRGDSSCVFSFGEDSLIDFQIVAQEDSQLKAKKEAAEERGDI